MLIWQFRTTFSYVEWDCYLHSNGAIKNKPQAFAKWRTRRMDEIRDTALSRNVVGKNRHFTRQYRKVTWDMININCSWNCSGRIYFCYFPLALANIHPWPFVSFFNFFEEQSTQNHPQYLSGCLRVLFPTIFLWHATFNIMGGFIWIMRV